MRSSDVAVYTSDQMRAYAAAAVEAEREQCAERVRLVSRIERLRGLCKTAVGMLHDAGRDDDAEVISELIGDMEV